MLHTGFSGAFRLGATSFLKKGTQAAVPTNPESAAPFRRKRRASGTRGAWGSEGTDRRQIVAPQARGV